MADRRRRAVRLRTLGLALAAMLALGAAARADDEARAHVAFERDNDANCVMREGQMILVRGTHPKRSVRVWLERYHMGAYTGDRSRSLLRPGAPAEKLGCSRTLSGAQEWRVLRAEFAD